MLDFELSHRVASVYEDPFSGLSSVFVGDYPADVVHRYDVASDLTITSSVLPMRYKVPWVSADLDRDGNLDIVFQSGASGNGYLDIHSAPDWGLRVRFTFPGMNAYMHARTCNIDADYALEVFATPNSLAGDARLVVIDYDPSGDSFYVAADVQAPPQTYGESAIADFDGDGKTEFMTGSFGGGYSVFEWRDEALEYVGGIGGADFGYDGVECQPFPGDSTHALLGYSTPGGAFRYELWKATSDNNYVLIDTFQVYTGWDGSDPCAAFDFDCDGLDELFMQFYPTFECWGWDTTSHTFQQVCWWDQDSVGTFIRLFATEFTNDGSRELSVSTHEPIFRSYPSPTCIKCDSAWSCPLELAPCECPCFLDPACDSVLSDIQDVVKVINTAFRGDAPVVDIYCPFERTDVTCDLRTDVLDVVGMVNVAFRGGDPESEFCLGCP